MQLIQLNNKKIHNNNQSDKISIHKFDLFFCFFAAAGKDFVGVVSVALDFFLVAESVEDMYDPLSQKKLVHSIQLVPSVPLMTLAV